MYQVLGFRPLLTVSDVDPNSIILKWTLIPFFKVDPNSIFLKWFVIRMTFGPTGGISYRQAAVVAHRVPRWESLMIALLLQ